MPRLSWNGMRFELECSRFESTAAKIAGFHFDGRVHWTGILEVAQKFKQHAEPRAAERFRATDKQIALSKALDAEITIPCPQGLAYLGFQKAGVQYILPRRDTLLADEMGLGKTITAAAVINADPSIKNILVIPPASLRLNWKKELETWLIRKLSGGFAGADYGRHIIPDTNIVIINYDIVKKFRQSIDERQWDLLICDEAHYLKNAGAQRTIAVLGEDGSSAAIKARRRMYLTGTPILNRPFELFPILHETDPEGLGFRVDIFGKRYCAGQQIGGEWDFSGASNLEDLQLRLRASVMLRRLKKDVLTELPQKRRQIIPIPNPGIKEVRRELEFYLNNETMIQAAKMMAEISQAAGDEDSYKVAIKQLRSTKQLAFEEMAKLRKQTAMAKVPYMHSFVQDALDQQSKVVVFAHHQEVVEQIYEKFKSKAVFMHGGTSMAGRQAAVDMFQNEAGCRLIVGSMGTMGTGWTLTASSYVLFAELDWVPANITQAEDRTHRIGQRESVLIQHIVFDQSLDATMAKRIVEKQEVIDKAINGPDTSLIYYGGGANAY